MATNKPVAVFHTRQGKRAEQLNQLLSSAGFTAIHYNLFNITAGEDFLPAKQVKLTPQDCLIFTSQYAVDWLKKAVEPDIFARLQQHPSVAVGQATSDYLQANGFTRVVTPVQHDSEGILSLPLVKQSNQAILFKGEQGRTHIQQSFKLANKVLKTYNVYKRSWQPLDARQRINIAKADQFVLTSGENALFLLEQADQALLDKLKQSPCFVPSERVRQILMRQGLTQVHNIKSANNQAIIQALTGQNGN